jgi:hypothetical protein
VREETKLEQERIKIKYKIMHQLQHLKMKLLSQMLITVKLPGKHSSLIAMS